MKGVVVISLSALARLVASTNHPTLPFDPETASDCIEWYNNYGDETCEEVLSVFNITPEEFHGWNPSVDLNCEPWVWQSYCILTEEKWHNKFPSTSSTTVTPTSTTSTVSLGPSPTAWGSLGCYVENDDSAFPVLEKNINLDGDAALTIPKCQDSCYKQAFDFAGVEGGNQCWCSSYVSGDWAQNQTSCNSPCTGDRSTSCGGVGFLDVFEAQHPDGPAPSFTTTPTTTATPTASSSTTPVAENSSSRTSTSSGPTTPTGNPTSSDGTCGGANGQTCLGSMFGNCCSVAGWCGASAAHCGPGCQEEFGSCGATNGKESPDGSCGGTAGYSCVGTEYGDCCSEYGWCGSSEGHCTIGCQTEFGLCN